MRLSIFLGVLSLSVALVSCKDNATSYSVGTGNDEINGFVSLRDSMSGNELQPHDFSGITVSVLGGSQRTTTDEDGQFTLSSLPGGKMTLVFSKPGFAESRDVDFEYKRLYYGAREMYQIRQLTPNLVLRPFEAGYVRFNFRDTMVYSQGASGYIHYWVYDSVFQEYGHALLSSRILDAPPQTGDFFASVIMYFSNRDSISPSDPNSYQFASSLLAVSPQIGEVSYDLYRDSLLLHGFVSNSNIYCAAYTAGWIAQSQSYSDKPTGKTIYTGLSPNNSGVKSFVLP